MLRGMSADQNVAVAIDRLALAPLVEALGAADAYLVGGWVRELVAGREPGGDLDVAVDGELEPVLERLEGLQRPLEIEVHQHHQRFGTATVVLDGLRVDLSRSRRERYPSPGALPEVTPAPIEEDLGRRDFTVNAVAIGLRHPHDLLDPFGGVDDIRAAVLRILHDRSFVDDPTRAIRAARYAARLDLSSDPGTLVALRATDLTTVSADRREAELARLANEPRAARGFELLAEWGLIEAPPEALELVAAIDLLSAESPWSGDPPLRGRAILLAIEGGPQADSAMSLAQAEPERPSEAMRLAGGHQPAELLLAAAAGCAWIQDFAETWSRVSLEISGQDLIAAGIPEGPAVGAGLRGALERKLDGGLSGGREAELAVAIELAREAI